MFCVCVYNSVSAWQYRHWNTHSNATVRWPWRGAQSTVLAYSKCSALSDLHGPIAVNSHVKPSSSYIIEQIYWVLMSMTILCTQIKFAKRLRPNTQFVSWFVLKKDGVDNDNDTLLCTNGVRYAPATEQMRSLCFKPSLYFYTKRQNVIQPKHYFPALKIDLFDWPIRNTCCRTRVWYSWIAWLKTHPSLHFLLLFFPKALATGSSLQRLCFVYDILFHVHPLRPGLTDTLFFEFWFLQFL